MRKFKSFNLAGENLISLENKTYELLANASLYCC
jgi:hypothetical protein